MNSVIIVAAGTGSRMNMGINKQLIKLDGKEIIVHTIEKFYKNDNIDEIILVIKKEEEQYFKDNIIDKFKFEKIKIAYGGKERQDSVFNGLELVNKNCEIILVHDGARPFLSNEIIKNCIESTKDNGAVVVGVPVKDTIKIVDSDMNIVDTPNRSNLWSVQTPQAFDYKLLIHSHITAKNDNFYGTDDAMLVEKYGQKVKVIEGCYNNIKVTTREDLAIGLQILKNNN